MIAKTNEKAKVLIVCVELCDQTELDIFNRSTGGYAVSLKGIKQYPEKFTEWSNIAFNSS